MREKSWFREYGLILAAGVAVGIAALILTASGGPFFGKSAAELERVTVQDALRLFETPGQELQQLLPGFRRRHLQWFRHGIPLKNTASPPAEGELHVLRVAVPAQERLRADFHAARKPESPARNASDGREIGQGIRSARAHDRNRSDARLQTLWRMRASLTRRRPFREKEYSPCSLSCPFPF